MAVLAIFMFLFFAAHACEVKETVLEDKLTIASWDVQGLGRSKGSLAKSLDIIAQVIKVYDIVVLEGISDPKGRAQKQLLDLLNAAIEDERKKYKILEPENNGKKRNKVKSVFFYRYNIVGVSEIYQQAVSKKVSGSGPYAVLFDSHTTTVEQFAIILVGSFQKSSSKEKIQVVSEELRKSSSKERNAMVEDYEDVSRHFGVKDAIIFGDSNSNNGVGKSISEERKLAKSDSIEDPKLLLLISGTTLPSRSWDSVAIAGESLTNSVYRESVMPNFFVESLFGVDKKAVRKVSRSYPVNLSIRGKNTNTLKLNMALNADVETTLSAIQKLNEDSTDIETRVHFEGDSLFNQKTSQSAILFVEYKQQKMTAISSFLGSISAKHPCIFTNEIVQVFKYKIANGFFKDPSLYLAPTSTAVLSANCLLNSRCSISLKSQIEIN